MLSITPPVSQPPVKPRQTRGPSRALIAEQRRNELLHSAFATLMEENRTLRDRLHAYECELGVIGQRLTQVELAQRASSQLPGSKVPTPLDLYTNEEFASSSLDDSSTPVAFTTEWSDPITPEVEQLSIALHEFDNTAGHDWGFTAK